MLLSVIICTYARAEALLDLLGCLLLQSYKNFEVLIVDGSGENESVRDAVSSFRAKYGETTDLSFIPSPKGLTRQRNIGMRYAKGNLFCFFDDDITFDSHFLAQVVALFERTDLQDIGGLTAYDTLNYPAPLSIRWRMRHLLRVVPSLEPGSIDRLGRSVPLGFMKPFSGVKSIGFFGGFCMIYRRSAISNLWFDEQLPTYGGEDRDFSFRVGQSSRLLISGDLHVQHHRAPESREGDIHRAYQDGFGTGRTFNKQSAPSDYTMLLWVVFGDIIVSVLAFVRKPSRKRLLLTFARPLGILAGFRSNIAQGFKRCTTNTADFRN